LTLREEYKLRAFVNRVLGRIFGPKKDEVAGGWRKLHNAELHNWYSSSSIITMIKPRWAGHIARTGEKRNAYRILVGKTEGQSPLGRPRCRWLDIIKMDIKGIGWGGMDWIDLAQDMDHWSALVNTVMILRVPYKMLGSS
jgi:hypothetical protein